MCGRVSFIPIPMAVEHTYVVLGQSGDVGSVLTVSTVSTPNRMTKAMYTIS
jgi:hypothetical protein